MNPRINITESPPDPCGKARLKSLQDLDQRKAAPKRARELIESISGDFGGDPTAAQGELV